MKTVRNFICCLVVALAMLIATASLAQESETNCDSVTWQYLCEQIAAEVDAFDDYYNERIIDSTFHTMEVFATIFAEDVDSVYLLPDGVKMEFRGIDENLAFVEQFSQYNYVEVIDNAPRRIHVIDPSTAVLMRDTTVVTEEGISIDQNLTYTLHKKEGGNWLVEAFLAVFPSPLPPPSPLP